MSNNKSSPEPETVTQQETGGDFVSRLVLGLFTVTCYRSLGPGLSVPDTWITGQSRESAEYHAWNGQAIERREAGCYHGPFRIIPENVSAHTQKGRVRRPDNTENK
jgi:hypothetical protein